MMGEYAEGTGMKKEFLAHCRDCGLSRTSHAHSTEENPAFGFDMKQACFKYTIIYVTTGRRSAGSHNGVSMTHSLDITVGSLQQGPPQMRTC